MSLEFISKAKIILAQTNDLCDCYHEAELTGNDNRELSAQLYYAPKDKYMEFIYTPEIAPCSDVLTQGELIITDKLIELYPEDKGLSYINAQSYIGLKTSTGLRALLSSKSLSSPQELLNLQKNL